MYCVFWLVCLRPVSRVHYFVDVSDLFVFVLCHVCTILSMSLICLSSSCVTCALFCRCLWFVCLRPVSRVPYFFHVSDLFVFVLCHVCPILSMSLICLSSSCVTCALFCRCLWFVCLRPVSRVPYFVDVSDLFVFVLCHVCPILSMSLICLSSSCVTCALFCRCLWFFCLRPVSRVPYFVDVSDLFVFVLCHVCPILSMSLICLSSSCVMCALFCRCLWFVCLRPVSRVPYFVDVSDLFVFVLCHVCPILSMSLICLSSSCVTCAIFCRCLWFVCLRPVSRVPYFVDVSDLLVFVLCHVCPILSMSLICLSSSCVMCALFCRCLWFVCLRRVSCVHYFVDVSDLFVFVLCHVCTTLSMSLICLSSSCVTCALFCRCLWFVCLRRVSCVHYFVDVSDLFVFVVCHVCTI